MKHEENPGLPNDVPILLKIGAHFIHEDTLRSIARFGKGCKITLSNGDELAVNVNYDKLMSLLEVEINLRHQRTASITRKNWGSKSC